MAGSARRQRKQSWWLSDSRQMGVGVSNPRAFRHPQQGLSDKLFSPLSAALAQDTGDDNVTDFWSRPMAMVVLTWGKWGAVPLGPQRRRQPDMGDR